MYNYWVLLRLLRRLYVYLLPEKQTDSIKEIDALFGNMFRHRNLFFKFDSSAVINYQLAKSGEQLASDFSKMAIIVQGSVRQNVRFVLESLALYEKLFSQCRIILSTWEDEREAIEKFFKDFDKTLVMYSKKPIEYGYSNINLQITSTRNALQAIEPNEYKVIVKTRSDQRITNRATMQKIYFDLLNQSQSKASRIYIPSMNTFLYRIFGASDMLQIARFETLRVFWNLEHDSRDSSNLRNKVNLAKNSSEYSALQLCEVFLTFKYAKSIDPRSEFNYVEWLKFLRDKTFVLDERELGLVWPKYSFDFARHGTGNIHSPMYQVSTFDWIRMQNSLETYQSLERNLYIPFEQEIR